MASTWTQRAVALALGCLAASPGCGTEPETSMRTGMQGAAGSGLPPGDDQAARASAAPSQRPSSGDDLVMVPGAAGACGATSMEAEAVTVETEVEVQVEVVTRDPVAMYILLDRSASMTWGYPAPWDTAKDAITAFVGNPQSDGIDVALQYFPVAGGSCGNGAGYDTPAVPMGRLPGHAPMVTGSLAGQMANATGTPTEGALRGINSFCRDFQTRSSSGERCVGVIVTDGDPTDHDGCSIDPAQLAGIASDGFKSDGIMTFAVGMGSLSDFTLLNAIASAGGTDCDPAGPNSACDVTGGATALIQALEGIRDTVTSVETHVEVQTQIQHIPLACEWRIPADPQRPFDKEQVNVSFTAPGMATPELGRVDSASACEQFVDGWYYDNAQDPQRILVCPDTCQMIQDTELAKVDILLGCPSIVLE